MHVLTQRMLLGGLEYDELLPLWAKRMRVILTPQPLFESIKMARTERGVTWHVIETAKLVAGDNGLVAVATGKDETYTVLDRLQASGCSLCPLWQNVGLPATQRHSAGPQPLHAHCHLYKGRLRPHGSQNGTAGQASRGAGRQARARQAQLWRLSDLPPGAGPDGNKASAQTASQPAACPSSQWLLHQAKHPLRLCGLQNLPTHPHKGRGAPMATARVGTQTGRAGGPAVTDPASGGAGCTAPGPALLTSSRTLCQPSEGRSSSNN